MVPNSRGSLAWGLPRVGTQLQVPPGRASGQQHAGRPVVARGAKGRNCKSSVIQLLSPFLIFFFLIYLKLLQLWSCLQAKTGKRFPETSLNKSPAGNWLSPTFVSLVSYMERRVTG